MSLAIDLALESIGFLTVPDSTIPPKHGIYNYQNFTVPSTKVLPTERIKESIGSSIHSTGILTPLQTKKLYIFTGMTLLTSGSLIALSVSTNPVVTPIACIAILASMILGIGGLAYYYSCYDLDRPAVREDVLNKIQSWDFSTIATTFTINELTNYHLLELVVDPTNVPSTYTQLQKLYIHKHTLDKEHKRYIAAAQATHKAGTAAIDNWISSCRSRNWVVDSYKNHNRNSQDTTVELLRSGIRTQLELKHKQLQAPWNSWLEQEKQIIDKSYQQALNILHTAYMQITQI